MKEEIYGITYETPRVPQNSHIMGFNLPIKKQKWVREPLPDMFDELDFDTEGDPVYTDEQIKWIEAELDKFEKGIWFFNNGKPTYITGLHYYYLRYWILENGEPPSYRDADRRWFWFQDFCESKAYIWGIIRAKKRREGATSQATASQMLDATTKKAAMCGIISKTGPDAKGVFQLMHRVAFKALPLMFKPDVIDEDSMTEYFFIKSKRKSKAKKKSTTKKSAAGDNYGLGSKIWFGTTALNTFDSGRQTKPLIDEGGKWPIDVPVNEYWGIIKKTMAIGGRRVGFALVPSTSNKLQAGGKAFKALWDESNQFKSQQTGSGLYRYFCPADQGYEPYIDEYGYSILGKPNSEQAKWMRQHYGATEIQCSMTAAEYIQYEIDLITNPETKANEKRMMPLTEKDAFDMETSDNIYDMTEITKQKDWLRDHPVPLRRVTYFRREDQVVDWKDDPKGFWLVRDFPTDQERNAFRMEKGIRKPANTGKYVLVADPFKNTVITGKGSNGAAIIGTKLNPLDPDNTGKPTSFFIGRPKLRRDFHRQMLYAAEYHGCEMGYESDFDDYLEFLDTDTKETRKGYAMERPKQTVDPNRKRKAKEKEWGMKSADPFTYAMFIDRSQLYVLLYCWKIDFMGILDDLEDYVHEDRTLHDAAVAFQLFCVAISEPIQQQKEKPKAKKPIIKTYNLTQNG